MQSVQAETTVPTPDPKPAKVTCTDVIKACDKALEEKNTAIKISDLAVTQLRDANGKLQTDLDKERESSNSVLKNPFLWGAVGILLGGLLFRK